MRSIATFLVAFWCYCLSSAPVVAADPVSSWPDLETCREFRVSNATVDAVIEGWCLAIDERKGNCIACHTFNISPWPENMPFAGNLAPPMVAMKARFPDSKVLRQTIEDASLTNRHTSMPPFLTHRILTASEIDKLMALLGTL